MTPITRRTTLALAGSLALPAIARADDTVRLGVSIPTATHSFTAAVVWWANKAKADLEGANKGLSVFIKTAPNAGEQADQLQDLLTANRINALVIFPFESAALTQPVVQVRRKGVYVTVVDRALTDSKDEDAYVAGDNTAFGREPAEYIVGALGGKGDVVALRGIATTLDNERFDAFTSVIGKAPGIRLLDAKYANWNRDDAFRVMQDYLTRFPHIDAVWAADDDMAIGVLKAIEQANRSDIRIVFGGAGSKIMVKKIIDGTDPRTQADVSYSPRLIYEAVTLTAQARLKGERLPERTIIPSVLITKSNAQDFYYPSSPY